MTEGQNRPCVFEGGSRWKPLGYLFYNHDGYVSVEIMAAHRAPYHDPDVLGGTPAERAEAISTYLSYSGPFEVLPPTKTP